MRHQSPLKEECIARALYSNEADYPGELSFEKDDLLRIISKKPEIEGCSEGWWLCVDKNGRRGIAPGNRLLPLPREAMQRFDDGFFRVAQPFMDDFFAFHSSPFDDPFFRGRSAAFQPSLRERLYEAPQIRRMNSCDDALKNVGVVRNIPIRVEKGGTAGERMCQSTVNIAEPPPSQRRFSDFPSEFRQTTTFGPPAPPRRSVDSLRPPDETPRASSDEEERRSVRSERSPQRTLIIPSAVPGRTIEIPFGDGMQRSFSQSWAPEPPRAGSPKPESQLDRLTQRLKTLAARPFRAPSNPGPTLKDPSLSSKDAERSPSPSSSGIGADLTDSSHSGEENKRTSDLSSLSGSEQNDANPRQQPYLGRIVTQPPPTGTVIQPVFNVIDSPIRNQGGLNVDEDIRRNESLPWNLIPTAIQPPAGPRGVGEVLEEEIQARKRVVLNKMSESLRDIENAVSQMNVVTAPQHWRVAHVLQPNMNTLRDAAVTIAESLEQFVDSTGRVSIDRNNPKHAEFARFLSPLSEERRLLTSLKKSLDNVGWSVANLSRDREQLRTMDSLEQFVSVAGGVPADCRRMFQWVQMLVPSSTVIFLSPIAKPTTNGISRGVPHTLTTPSTEEKRLSSSSTSSNAASLDTPPSSILVTKPNVDKPRGRVTFADETTSNSSSNGDNSSLEYASIQKPTSRENENRILEEDDLESVASDRESLFQDYAYLDDVVPGRSNGNSAPPKARVSAEDRQIVRFYAPQLDQHTDSLSHAIEEFLEVVEKHLPPREFVQKGKLIILAAHKLIYIGDNVSQCVRDRGVSKVVRECADELCDHLQNCVRATKVAAEEFPEIRSMQTMVDTIIAVSKSAHRLKLLIGECC